MIVYTGQYNENKSDLLNLDLEPVMASLKAKEGIDQYIKCYAAIEELKNTKISKYDVVSIDNNMCNEKIIKYINMN